MVLVSDAEVEIAWAILHVQMPTVTPTVPESVVRKMLEAAAMQRAMDNMGFAKEN